MNILVSLVIALALFVITNWLGKHSLGSGYFQIGRLSQSSDSIAFNYSYRIFAPTALLVLIAAAMYTSNLGQLIACLPAASVLYWAIRFGFYFVAKRLELVNLYEFFAIATLSIVVYLLVHHGFVVDRELLFPTRSEVGAALWFGVTAFVYKSINSIEVSEAGAARRRTKYVIQRADEYIERYGRIIRQFTDDKFELNLVIAVMIYEGLNRPHVAHWAERLILAMRGRASVGPMQVVTQFPMSDEESIRAGAEIILSAYRHAKNQEPGASFGYWVNEASRAYNLGYDYPAEISEIMRILEPDHLS